MSSIYGKINFNKKPVEADELAAMENSLNHWEVDAIGQWHSIHAGLGHLMLYNTPESLHEKLPTHNNTGNLTITADARIDNRDELFEKLYKEDLDKTIVTDSDLILKAYETYGEDCIKHLIGDFVFAIWNEREQQLFCARDHMGVKPFFYYQDDNFFAFASEKKGLLVLSGLNKEVNEDYLLKIVGKINPILDETLYLHIKRLPGAHTLSLRNKQVSIKRYWDLDTSKRIYFDNPKDYTDRFLELFKEAVRCRLRSAYPIGAELSGGLDSSGITCVAANLLHAENRELSSFSYALTPEEAAGNSIKTEEFFADEVINFAKVDRPVKVCSSDYTSFMEETDLSLRINDGPYHRTIWHNPIKKAAGAHGVRILLSGFAGDEMVTNGSYLYAMDYAIRGQYKAFFKVAKKKTGIAGAFKLLVHVKAGKNVMQLLKPYFNRKEFNSWKKHDRNFLVPAYFYRVKKHVKAPLATYSFREFQKQRILNSHVSERMEMEDRMGLLYKLETRFPMADVRLIEFVLALPLGIKTNSEITRFLFRSAMKGLMPTAVLDRDDKTILMQPFLLKELAMQQEEAREWALDINKKGSVPDYINTDKLLQYYFKDEACTILNDPGKKKMIHNILKWNIRSTDKGIDHQTKKV